MEFFCPHFPFFCLYSFLPLFCPRDKSQKAALERLHLEAPHSAADDAETSHSLEELENFNGRIECAVFPPPLLGFITRLKEAQPPSAPPGPRLAGAQACHKVCMHGLRKKQNPKNAKRKCLSVVSKKRLADKGK